MELESRLQRRPGSSYYGNHPMHDARWLPLAILTQQGAEAANLVVAEKSADVP
jgi:hypothetical protein